MSNEVNAKKVMEWTCGTLKYNWKSLAKVWFFSMLGTLMLNLMVYSLVPSLMPRILDKWKIDALRISLMMNTIPQILNMCINPVLSTWSDKVRSRWGRRIPFVVISAPFLVILMIMFGYHETIVPAFQRMTGLEMTEAAFWILCIITVFYQIFYLVPGAIQCYVAPDVIPKSFIGTYYGVVSLFGNLVGFAFNLWILPRADVDPKFWFTVIGIFYLAAMALQFFFVKEGQYPPTEKHEGGNIFVTIGKYIAAYVYECWSQPIYLCIFITSGITAASTIVRATFNVLFATNELGLTMTQYGEVFCLHLSPRRHHLHSRGDHHGQEMPPVDHLLPFRRGGRHFQYLGVLLHQGLQDLLRLRRCHRRDLRCAERRQHAPAAAHCAQ